MTTYFGSLWIKICRFTCFDIISSSIKSSHVPREHNAQKKIDILVNHLKSLADCLNIQVAEYLINKITRNWFNMKSLFIRKWTETLN